MYGLESEILVYTKNIIVFNQFKQKNIIICTVYNKNMIFLSQFRLRMECLSVSLYQESNIFSHFVPGI